MLATITKAEQSAALTVLCDDHVAKGGMITVLTEDLTPARIAAGNYRVLSSDARRPCFKNGKLIPQHKESTVRAEHETENWRYYRRWGVGVPPEGAPEARAAQSDADISFADAMENGLSLSGKLSINHPEDGVPYRPTGLFQHGEAEKQLKAFCDARGLDLEDLTIAPQPKPVVIPPGYCQYHLCGKLLPPGMQHGAKFCPDSDHGKKYARHKSKIEKDDHRRAMLREGVVLAISRSTSEINGVTVQQKTISLVERSISTRAA
jgi:hypothetical protein